MLSSCKNFYLSNANKFPGWDKLSRSELCNKYLEYKEKGDTLNTGYCLSGIIYKFWNIATHMFYSQSKEIATESDCYNVLIDAIIYALENHVWTNPSSSLYKDPNGPEKAINVRFNSLKINFFVANQRAKRVLNSNSLSLEKISENASDSYFLRYDADNEQSYANDLVKSSFDKGEFFRAFLIDSIISYNFIDHESSKDGSTYAEFNYLKLKRHLRNIDKNYCRLFANKYNLNYNSVEYYCDKLVNFSRSKLDRSVQSELINLSNDSKLISNLKGE